MPDRYLYDPAHPMTEADWDQLEIPVGLAFFLRSSEDRQVAGFYTRARPGPTESPRSGRVGPDSPGPSAARRHRARRGGGPHHARTDDVIEYFLVPIDACYELAGRMRLHWRGFDGGTEARHAIAEFLDGVRSRARPLGQGPS